MFTKVLGITTALLAISSGCTSSESTPARTAQSRRDSTAVAARNETPLYPQQNPTMTSNGYHTNGYQTNGHHTNGYHTMQPANTNSQVSSNSTMHVNDNQTARAADTGSRPGLESAAERQGRVSMISAKEPPLTRVETPDHQPNQQNFWVSGHWVADANGFTWTEGHTESYRPNELFVAGGWAATPRGWEYTPSYWR